MKKTLLTLLGMVLMLSAISLNAQDETESPEMIATAVGHKVIGPLRDFPALTPTELAAMSEDEAKVKRNQDLKVRNYPFYEQYKLDGPDPAWQSEMGKNRGSKGILQNWTGQSTSSNPPDDNGTAGPNHFMQTINVRYTIYDKMGSLQAGPTNLNTIFSGVPGANRNDGDPIILWDEQAQRYLMAEFSLGSPYYMLIAVSQTDDPTGFWDAYSFVMSGMPDYMKFGVWRDGYYMGTNTYSGSDIYVFERDEMLAGGTSPQMVQFNNPYRPNSGFHCVLPVDNDGTFAPSGTPGMFLTINDNAWGGSSSDQLWLFELDVDWTTPGSSTFSRVQQIDVASFDSNFGSNWENIKQPGTGQELDAINQILMHRVQYRNFGSSQTIVCNHTVDVDATDHAGVRWYELEHNGTDWEVRQYGTYAPDGDSRWMGSMAMNGDHEIAVGYSVSSNTTYPSIRYAGQSAAENATASGILDIAEESIYAGTVSQTSSERWGDYSNLSVDPSDDHTFWFTTQYNISSFTKGTKIASFEFAPATLVANFEADKTTPSTVDTVTFTDLTTAGPDTWLWTFTPNTVTHLYWSNNTVQNPIVRFDAPGLYTVELTASNSGESHTVTKVDYINATEAMLAPVADFEADNTNPGLTDVVQFTDLSVNDPTSWAWFFSPTTLTYMNGSTAASQNPEVRFDAVGLYTVTLTSTNSIGSDDEVKVDYIDAMDGMTTTASASPEELCEGDGTQLNAVPVGGSGSYTYTWTSDPAGFNSSIQNPLAFPEENTTYYVEVSDGANTANADVSVTVNPLPLISLGDWPENLCNVGVPPVQLTALPGGGTYTGPGVSINGVFISSLANIGWNVITYTYEDANACKNSGQDSIYVDNCVGLEDLSATEESVNLYPNPSGGAFTLESEETIEKIEIIDQSGRMVMMRKINDKNTAISALRSKGYYFMRVYIENQNAAPTVVTKEFIIK